MRIPLIATATDLFREIPEEQVQAEKPRALAYIEAVAACAMLVAAGLALAAA